MTAKESTSPPINIFFQINIFIHDDGKRNVLFKEKKWSDCHEGRRQRRIRLTFLLRSISKKLSKIFAIHIYRINTN